MYPLSIDILVCFTVYDRTAGVQLPCIGMTAAVSSTCIQVAMSDMLWGSMASKY